MMWSASVFYVNWSAEILYNFYGAVIWWPT